MFELNEKGQVLGLALIVLTLVLVGTITVASGSYFYSQSSLYTGKSAQALALAEAGVDKALSSLNASSDYTGEDETAFGEGSYSVQVTAINLTTYQIQATGYIPNKSQPKSKRTIQIQAGKGISSGFSYGVQAGDGGVQIGDNIEVSGGIYSNGNISTGENTKITGDVYVAQQSLPSFDQKSDCSGLNCQAFDFGKNVSGQDRQDVSQSFTPSVSGKLSKIGLKLKKIGSPHNLLVQIMADNGGVPDKNTVLSSANLSASAVTGVFKFTDVTLQTAPTLTSDTRYWIMVHASSLDNSNYWSWSEDSLQSYSQGSPAWSSDWQSASPDWSSVLADLGFITYSGSLGASLSMNSGSEINGNVHAGTISLAIIDKDAYYQSISDSTVKGNSFPNSQDSSPQSFNISDSAITSFKDQSTQMGSQTGDVSGCPASLTGKIIGSVNLSGHCQSIVRSPIWITGNLNLGESSSLSLDNSFGSSSGVIVVDGQVTFGSNAQLEGSGTAGSYLMIITTYDSSKNSSIAVNIGSGSLNGIVFAPLGEVDLSSGSVLPSVSAWKVNLISGSKINYQSGLSNLFFSSGPSGSLNLVKGTYRIL